MEIEAAPPHFSEESCHCHGFILQALAWDNQLLHLTFSRVAHAEARLWLQRRYPAAAFGPSRRLREEIRARFHLFAGQGQSFSPPVHPLFLNRGTAFHQEVWRLLGKIPPGETRTYGELARELGRPGYARAVGGACGANPLVLLIPCHRVVAARGLGGFNGGVNVKERLLAMERRKFAC